MLSNSKGGVWSTKRVNSRRFSRPSSCKARIFENGETELDLGNCLLL